MSPLDWYVLVFSPIVVVALAVVPLALARRDVGKHEGRQVSAAAHLGSSWHAAAHGRRKAVLNEMDALRRSRGDLLGGKDPEGSSRAPFDNAF